MPTRPPRRIDADGWLRTGDIVTVDEDGTFQIVDRLKELIKYKGYQVPPAELEARAADQPGDRRCRGDRRGRRGGGRDPEGVRRAEADVVMTPAEVMDFVAAHVAPHMRVRACEFIDEKDRAIRR